MRKTFNRTKVSERDAIKTEKNNLIQNHKVKGIPISKDKSESNKVFKLL